MITSMKRVLIFLLFFCFPITSHALTLKDKLLQAHEGDFIVTEQNKIYSMLVVRDITEHSIELEEISIPANQINLKKTTWRKWLENNAPGSSSWMLYQIDFVEEKLKESYSFSQNKWLYADDTDYLLAKLLTLPLIPVSKKERRRIGPPPTDGDEDRRAVWNPQMVREGSKVKKPNYEVYRGKWPKDNSQLSECNILFYFDSETSGFPFPYWLELNNGYISLKLRTIDSGATLKTPLAHVALPPHFNFTGPVQSLEESLRLTLMSLNKNPKLELFARDLTDPEIPLQQVKYTVSDAQRAGIVHLDISKKVLSSRLISGHKYQWVLRSKYRPNMIVENRDSFTWPHN